MLYGYTVIATGACAHCGRIFKIKPQTRGRFCSRECWRAYEVARKSVLACVVCGKSFRVSPRDVSRGQQCCSAGCGRAYQSSRASRTPIEERFWGLVEKTEGCWLWRGGTARGGYGNLFVRRGQPVVLAHKFSYELANGLVPDGIFVLHKCDTPACVRPDHLFLGNALTNARDCAAKGRTVHGSRQPNAKLTELQATEIARRCVSGESHARIASDYGVSRSLVSMIAKGKIWRRATIGII